MITAGPAGLRTAQSGARRKRFRIPEGESNISRFEEEATGAVRRFCRRCGTPLFYERADARHMINDPRALFHIRTGRQPIYHIAIEEMQDWTYSSEPLVPLKDYPGLFWSRTKKNRRVPQGGVLWSASRGQWVAWTTLRR